jgi:hypothetical protein
MGFIGDGKKKRRPDYGLLREAMRLHPMTREGALNATQDTISQPPSPSKADRRPMALIKLIARGTSQIFRGERGRFTVKACSVRHSDWGYYSSRPNGANAVHPSHRVYATRDTNRCSKSGC